MANVSQFKIHPEGSGHVDLMDSRALLPNEVKAVVKLLRHLRDDLQREGLTYTQLNTWTLKCVLLSCKGFGFRQEKWQLDLKKLLISIRALALMELEGMRQFYEEDSITPLFPTAEGFNVPQLIDFVEAVLSQLRSFTALDDSKM